MENSREVFNHSDSSDKSEKSHPSAQPEPSVAGYSFMRGLDSDFGGYDTEVSVGWQGYESNKRYPDSATDDEEEDSATLNSDEVGELEDYESDGRDVISYCSCQDESVSESDGSKSDVDNTPKFTVTVRANNLIGHYGITIPTDFARRFLPAENRNWITCKSMSMELRTQCGPFEVYYHFNTYRGGSPQLGYGWMKFAAKNSLRVNDRLEFKLYNPAR